MNLHTYRCKLIRVIDGDTVELSVDLGFNLQYRATFRLHGVNAPESRTSNSAEKELGLRSKQWLTDTLGDHAIVAQTMKDDVQEKFGRYLVRLFIGDRCVNDAMIAEGMAVEYFGGKR